MNIEQTYLITELLANSRSPRGNPFTRTRACCNRPVRQCAGLYSTGPGSLTLRGRRLGSLLAEIRELIDMYDGA